MLYFKNWSTYKNYPLSSKLIKEKKTSSNSLALCATSGKKIVLFVKPYSVRLDALFEPSLFMRASTR